MDDLTRAIAAAARYDEPLSLLVLDLVDREADEQAAGEALLRLDPDHRHRRAHRARTLRDHPPSHRHVGGALVAARVAALEQHHLHRSVAQRSRASFDATSARGRCCARARGGRLGRVSPSLSELRRDLDAVERDRRRRPVAAVAVDERDAVDDVLSRRHLPEDGVLAVEPRCRLGGDDEELRAVRVRPGVRHRERTLDDLVVVELVLELVARAAGADALRTAALDHEVGDHAVEDRARRRSPRLRAS